MLIIKPEEIASYMVSILVGLPIEGASKQANHITAVEVACEQSFVREMES